MGNHRCNLIGQDLNRVWKDPDVDDNPTIYHTKNMMLEFGLWNQIDLFVDLHAHSKKKNIFMYGCNSIKNYERKILIRVFPKILSIRCRLLSFPDCAFNLYKSKNSTARIVGM